MFFCANPHGFSLIHIRANLGANRFADSRRTSTPAIMLVSYLYQLLFLPWGLGPAPPPWTNVGNHDRSMQTLVKFEVSARTSVIFVLIWSVSAKFKKGCIFSFYLNQMSAMFYEPVLQCFNQIQIIKVSLIRGVWKFYHWNIKIGRIFLPWICHCFWQKILHLGTWVKNWRTLMVTNICSEWRDWIYYL